MTENRDQILMRMRDLYRMRELIQAHGRNGELRISELPGPLRAEVRELSDRIGELDS